MRTRVICIFIITVILIVTLCNCGKADKDSNMNYCEYDNIKVILSENLCNSRDAYDACMYLMIPMHYSFESNDVEKIELFTEQFRCFAQDGSSYDSLNTMYKLSWLYLSSQYMKLMCISGRSNNIPDGLFEMVDNSVLEFWNHYSGSYNAEFAGMEELLQEVLYGDGYSIDKSYSHAICDVEQFILAIMCDMAVCDDYFGEHHQDMHDGAAKWSKKMMQVKVEWQNDGGWLFGVGDMTDHQDYIYAGQPNIIPNMQPIYDPEVVDDSSHFSRIPLFLVSYRDAQIDEDDYEYFNELRNGLAIQFKEHVLFFPDDEAPYVRITNYMDGKNGVYRYSYHEEGIGYSSWELSGALFNGWWAALNDEDVSQAYEIMCSQIPFDEEEKDFYTSGVTIRELNPELTGWGGIYYRLFCASQLELK